MFVFVMKYCNFGTWSSHIHMQINISINLGNEIIWNKESAIYLFKIYLFIYLL